MIFGIGTDIIEVERIKDSIEKYGEKFLSRIFTDSEREYCESYGQNKFLHYAARFAAKESFSKAIGTGITSGFKFNEIAVRNEESGKPFIELYGGLYEKYSGYEINLSLSHTQGNAVAFLIIMND
ncbi:MAG: holo-ACP synthase [Candidatus Kapabacteria bacterium]|nr:holo-ACP synthase [Candidatus Kapabacteria bacterium]